MRIVKAWNDCRRLLLPMMAILGIASFGAVCSFAQDLPPAASSDPSLTLEEQLADLRSRLDAQAAELDRMRTSAGTSGRAPVDESEDRTLRNTGYVYDNGFVIQGQSRDGDEAFRLRINSWVQLRHTYFASEGPTSSENDLEFERVRFVMTGHVFSKSLTYYTQVDADNDRGQTLSILDYFLSYDAGVEWLDLKPGTFGIRAGEWKLPFNRARRISSQRVSFSERSMTTLFFDIERSVGVSLYGTADMGSTPLNWEFALFDGFRTSGARPGRAGDLDRNFATSGRMFADLLSEWGEDSESDLVRHDQPALRLGAGYAVGKMDAEGEFEFSRQRTVDTGEALDAILPAGVDHYKMASFTVDANFKYCGWSFIADYYWRTLFDFGPTPVNNLFDHGFLLQTGYFVVPKKLELISRWDRIVGDSSTLGAANGSADELGFGAVYYINGHNMKLIFDASHVNGAVLNESALNMRPGDVGWYYRTQFQLSF